MNFRLTAIFFGAVVVVVAALLGMAIWDDDEKATPPGLVSEFTSAGLKEKDVDTLEIARTNPAEEKLVFVKADGKWELRDPFRAKVDAAAVEGVLRDLFAAKPTRYSELKSNPAVHGLDKPTVTVTIRQGADRSATVNLGDTTIGGNNAVTFVTTSANPTKPIAVKKSDLGNLFRDGGRDKDGAAWTIAKWLPDYRARKLLGADLTDPSLAQAVKVTAGGKTLALKRADNGAWVFESPDGYGEADDLGDSTPSPGNAPITGVRPLINTLTSLQVMAVDDYVEKPEDLAKYGLKPDDPAAVRVELKGRAGTEVLWLGKVVEENGKPVVPTKVYAKLEGDSSVVKVQTDRLEAIRQTVNSPGELRNKDVLPTTRRDRIDALDLTVGANTVKLRKVPTAEGPPRWVLYAGPEPREARSGEVEALLTALTRPRAAREILPKTDDAPFAEKKAEVKVWYDGVEKPEKVEAGKLPAEPKLKGNPTTLTFGRQEGDAVFVRKEADGGRVDMKLPDLVLGQVSKGRLDLIDPGVKSFDTLGTNRLAFNRGSEPYDLRRVESALGGWTFEMPEGRKGKPADAFKASGLVGLLAGLHAERVVAENPTPDDLKKWGLEPARMRVTVGLKDAPDKERVYEFGNPTDDGKFVHARQAGSPFVFLVAKPTFDRLAADDLRDPTLFRLDLAKVKRVKLRGWVGLNKSLGGTGPLEYLLEKQPTGWVAVSPPTPAGFVPDPAKVNALLASLAAPKADAFVDVGGKPEYGLDVAVNPDGLEFSIEQDAEPKFVTLVLGNKTADGLKVFAASSAVPGEVFTFSPASLRGLIEKPASLQR